MTSLLIFACTIIYYPYTLDPPITRLAVSKLAVPLDRLFFSEVFQYINIIMPWTKGRLLENTEISRIIVFTNNCTIRIINFNPLDKSHYFSHIYIYTRFWHHAAGGVQVTKWNSPIVIHFIRKLYYYTLHHGLLTLNGIRIFNIVLLQCLTYLYRLKIICKAIYFSPNQVINYLKIFVSTLPLLQTFYTHNYIYYLFIPFASKLH